MAANTKFVTVTGSERAIPAGARYVGPVDANERIEVLLLVRPAASRAAPFPARPKRHLTREEYAAQFGATPADMDRVDASARAAGLELVAKDPARRTVTVAGPASKVLGFLKAEVGTYEHNGRRFRFRKGPVSLPSEIAELVVGVFGIDDRPVAKPHLRVASPEASLAPFAPPQLGQLYEFPSATSGKGQCIALVELGGGYRQSDIDAYFQSLGVKAPTVVSVGVDGASNAPSGQANGPDGEVMLDIEVAGALAPDATLAVYFAPNTDKGFLDAVLAAVHDSTLKPSVLSISWGGAEANWTAQAMSAFDGAFAAAATMGITVCCAAGDDGATDGVADGLYHVDFPASSPHVLACGGTRLVVSNGMPSETVWNDLSSGGGATGGGVSDRFDRPAWQASAGVPLSLNPGHREGRGVPDVAGDADPATGYRVRVDGQDLVIGGTSAVAPLWAALLARCNEALGHGAGFVNPSLYARASASFRDVVSGSNGPSAYQAGPGWDACTGLGTPIGTQVLDDLTASSA